MERRESGKAKYDKSDDGSKNKIIQPPEENQLRHKNILDNPSRVEKRAIENEKVLYQNVRSTLDNRPEKEKNLNSNEKIHAKQSDIHEKSGDAQNSFNKQETSDTANYNNTDYDTYIKTFISECRNYSKEESIYINESNFQKMVEFFKTHPYELELPNMGRETMVYLHTVQKLEMVQCLIISAINIDVISEVTFVVNIKKLLFKEIPTKKMLDFMKTYCKSLSWEFKDIELDYSNLSMIVAAIKECNIPSVSFNNAFHKSRDMQLNVIFEDDELKNVLTSLSIMNYPNEQLRSVVSQLRRLSHIDISNTDIEIPDFISYMSENSFPMLTAINLSSNNYTGIISDPEKVEFPKSLYRLDVGNVKFCSGGVNNLFEIIFKQEWKYGLRLYVPKIGADSRDLAKLNSFIEGTLFESLIELDWSYNELSPQLFSWLYRNHKLNALFMNSCFNSSTKTFVHQLIKLMVSIQNIRVLSLTGTKEHNIGPEIPRILETARMMERLNYLDISNHYGGEKALNALAVLSTHSQDVVVNVDGCGVKDVVKLQDAMNVIFENGGFLRISWPSTDLNGVNDIGRLHDIFYRMNKATYYRPRPYNIFPSTLPTDPELFLSNPSPFEVFIIKPNEVDDLSSNYLPFEEEDNNEQWLEKRVECVSKQKAFLKIVSQENEDQEVVRDSDGRHIMNDRKYEPPKWDLDTIPVRKYDSESIRNVLQHKFSFSVLRNEIQ